MVESDRPEMVAALAARVMAGTMLRTRAKAKSIDQNRFIVCFMLIILSWKIDGVLPVCPPGGELC